MIRFCPKCGFVRAAELRDCPECVIRARELRESYRLVVFVAIGGAVLMTLSLWQMFH